MSLQLPVFRCNPEARCSIKRTTQPPVLRAFESKYTYPPHHFRRSLSLSCVRADRT